MAGKNKKISKKTGKIKEKELIFYLIIAAFIMLMMPHMIRFFSGNTTLIGEQAYYHERTAKMLLNLDLAGDDMVYGGRDFIILPYHIALAAAGYFTGTGIASKLLPFVFGILSTVLFYELLKHFKIRPFDRLIISLLLIISPPFVYLFSVSASSSFSVFLTLLGLYLFIQSKKIKSALFALSLLSFILASFSGTFNSLLILAMIFLFSMRDGRNKNKGFAVAAVLLAAYFINPVKFYYSFELPAKNILKSLVSDLGAITGFSIFSIMLAVIGIFHSWRKKEKLYPLYLTALFLMVSALYIGGETNLYSNFLAAVFAGLGLQKLKTIKWRFIPVKNLSFIIIACGVLFSMISYMDRLPFSMPDSNVKESLEWLEENSDPSLLVLSHYSRGYWIESIAKRPVLIDSFSVYNPGFDKKQSDMKEMFYGVDLDDTAKLFRKYNVSYIFVDNEMRQGLVWNRDKEGLLYLLRNNKTFKKVHSNNGTEVWKVYGIY